MKQLQLFLLPFAGGSSVSFKKLTALLDMRIEPITIEYAGRMTRRAEPYIDNYECFLMDVAKQIYKQKKFEIPYAVFGYSLGSVLIYDLLSQDMLGGNPVHVFICSKGSLIDRNKDKEYSECSENEFIQEIAMLGGTDERILKNKRFHEIFLMPAKADFAVWEQYVFKEEKSHVMQPQFIVKKIRRPMGSMTGQKLLKVRLTIMKWVAIIFLLINIGKG